MIQHRDHNKFNLGSKMNGNTHSRVIGDDGTGRKENAHARRNSNDGCTTAAAAAAADRHAKWSIARTNGTTISANVHAVINAAVFSSATNSTIRQSSWSNVPISQTNERSRIYGHTSGSANCGPERRSTRQIFSRFRFQINAIRSNLRIMPSMVPMNQRYLLEG
ncbi:hypothetical protein ACH3XW_32295 [Acanthocheilonema viteae]